MGDLSFILGKRKCGVWEVERSATRLGEDRVGGINEHIVLWADVACVLASDPDERPCYSADVSFAKGDAPLGESGCAGSDARMGYS
jgi:hypothetical protein